MQKFVREVAKAQGGRQQTVHVKIVGGAAVRRFVEGVEKARKKTQKTSLSFD